jgi:hypothetical protein
MTHATILDRNCSYNYRFAVSDTPFRRSFLSRTVLSFHQTLSFSTAYPRLDQTSVAAPGHGPPFLPASRSYAGLGGARRPRPEGRLESKPQGRGTAKLWSRNPPLTPSNAA